MPAAEASAKDMEDAVVGTRRDSEHRAHWDGTGTLHAADSTNAERAKQALPNVLAGLGRMSYLD